MPKWSEDDYKFAESVARNTVPSFVPYVTGGAGQQVLFDDVSPLSTPETRGPSTGGPSDDIGDVMWTVPTITVGYPSNIPNTTGHHVTAAMAMATPIAHKGAVAGAKVVAMTVLDLLEDPALLASARDYFQNEQLQGTSYDSVLGPDDVPAIDLNQDLMERMRPAMREFYYDPSKYGSYLEQLGIEYPPAD
jgi:aminobenzoyl-glutamate utilization protein B